MICERRFILPSMKLCPLWEGICQNRMDGLVIRVDSFEHKAIHDQSYYFELLIKSTDEKYSSNMPYLQHSDILARFEAIELSGEKNSSKMHFYRSYMGKSLQSGLSAFTSC